MRNQIQKIVMLVLLASLSGLAGCKKEEASPAEPQLMKARDLYAKSEFAGAAQRYDEALKLDPKLDISVWEKTAFSYSKAGNFDRAGELLIKTLDFRAPGARADTYRNAAGMYLQGLNHEKAEQYFGEALKLDPNDEASLAWMAEIASIRGGARRNTGAVFPEHLETAVARYDQLIALHPAVPAPYISKRIALIRQVNYYAEQKVLAERTAKQEKSKPAAAAATEAAKKAEARMEELKAKFLETNKKLGEVQKAARAAK